MINTVKAKSTKPIRKAPDIEKKSFSEGQVRRAIAYRITRTLQRVELDPEALEEAIVAQEELERAQSRLARALDVLTSIAIHKL